MENHFSLDVSAGSGFAVGSSRRSVITLRLLSFPSTQARLRPSGEIATLSIARTWTNFAMGGGSAYDRNPQNDKSKANVDCLCREKNGTTCLLTILHPVPAMLAHSAAV